jgi:hypothetical protein
MSAAVAERAPGFDTLANRSSESHAALRMTETNYIFEVPALRDRLLVVIHRPSLCGAR